MSILKKPIVTEKFNKLSEKLNKYSFEVARTANKIEIKGAVEAMYGVKVEDVNTCIKPGKSKSRFSKTGAIAGRTNTVKRAVVTVAKGEKIDFYSNI